MADLHHEIPIRLADFDRTLLDPDKQHLEGEALRLAVREHFEREFLSSTGASEVIVTGDTVTIRWAAGSAATSITELGAEHLSAGDYGKGISLLELALQRDPDDEEALFNLGMALSDQGRLEEAIARLQHLVELDGSVSKAWVALGVALLRKNDIGGGADALRRAIECDPDDGFALMNLGVVLAENEETLEEAGDCLTRSARILPESQQVWINMGKLREKEGDLDAADEAYLKVIGINPSNQIAEMAKARRGRIAEQGFREKGHRPDALMYCLGALQKFAGMTTEEVRAITFEIATLGMGGLDVNNPAHKYTIRNLPGKYSGLHLLCIEYVGFKQLDPSVDIGFDLTKEYAEAKALHGS